jgi:O-antigen/teichoic acid export membrane protein
VQLAGYFADLKLQEVAIREIAAEPERENVWLGALVSLRVALGIPVAVLAAVVLVVMARSHAMRIAGIVIALTLATGALTAAAVVFQLRVRNDVTMALVTFNSLAWGAAVVAITSAGGGMVPLAIAFTASSLLTAVLQAWLASRRAPIRLRGSREHWPVLLRVGAAVGLAGLLTLAYGRIDQVIVFELAPHRSDPGLYGGIYRILNSAAFVPNAVMTTLLPLIATAVRHDPGRARRLVQRALEYLAMVSLPALAFSLAASRPLLRLLLGSQFQAAAGALPILMGAYVAICWGYVAGNMVIVLGLQARFIRYAVFALALNVGLNLALVPTYGYRAAAWVTLVTEFAVVGLSLRAVLGEISLRPNLVRLARIASVAVLLLAALLGLRAAGAGLAVLVVASAVLYPPLLIVSRALDLAEVRSLLAARRA